MYRFRSAKQRSSRVAPFVPADMGATASFPDRKHAERAANVDIGVLRTWAVKSVTFSSASELTTWGHPRARHQSSDEARARRTSARCAH